MKIRELHALNLIVVSISASGWAIFDTDFRMPLIWLGFVCGLAQLVSPDGLRQFLARFIRIGAMLLMISLLQIIFRRDGEILLKIGGMPLVFTKGIAEAILLWIRFMIIFALAQVFAQLPLFKFLLLANRAGASLNLSLLLLTSFRLIPFIRDEARKSLWFMRFRGIELNRLPLRQKWYALRQVVTSLLMRGMRYVSVTGFALELRGYGQSTHAKIETSYPMKAVDRIVIGGAFLLNLTGVWFKLKWSIL